MTRLNYARSTGSDIQRVDYDPRMRISHFILFAGLTFSVAACGGQSTESASEVTVTATVTETATATKTVEVEPSPTEDAELEETEASEESDLTVVDIGDEVDLPSAKITVTDVEQVDSLAEGRIQPGDDETLWLVSMQWTNTSNEAVSKVCHGPDVVDLEVYDTEDREMLDSNDSGFIDGNDCSNGLLTGQSGTWYEAFIGGEKSEIGYAAFFEGYGTPPTAVILNEDIELTRDN